MRISFILIISALLLCVQAYYLPLALKQCTISGGCGTVLQTQLVMDSMAASSASDFQGQGITSDGTTVTFARPNTKRLYLVNANANSYEMFQLLNMEFAFDVNPSNVACGGVGALYLTAMSPSGYATGAGYCDANGVGGSWCNEMDIWEANAHATAFTSHSCNSPPSQSNCDSWGCQLNPYKNGQTSFYGPSSSYTVNTAQTFTVVTQFITDSGTSSGNLVQVKQTYVQNGINIDNTNDDSLSNSYCANAANWNQHGGLAGVGSTLSSGMVLSLSLWSGSVSWLDDPTGNGPCSSEAGSVGSVTFGNFRMGPIGSTTGSSSSTSAPATSAPATSAPATSAPATSAPATSAPTSAPSTSAPGSGVTLTLSSDANVWYMAVSVGNTAATVSSVQYFDNYYTSGITCTFGGSSYPWWQCRATGTQFSTPFTLKATSSSGTHVQASSSTETPGEVLYTGQNF